MSTKLYGAPATAVAVPLIVAVVAFSRQAAAGRGARAREPPSHTHI